VPSLVRSDSDKRSDWIPLPGIIRALLQSYGESEDFIFDYITNSEQSEKEKHSQPESRDNERPNRCVSVPETQTVQTEEIVEETDDETQSFIAPGPSNYIQNTQSSQSDPPESNSGDIDEYLRRIIGNQTEILSSINEVSCRITSLEDRLKPVLPEIGSVPGESTTVAAPGFKPILPKDPYEVLEFFRFPCQNRNAVSRIAYKSLYFINLNPVSIGFHIHGYNLMNECLSLCICFLNLFG